MFFSTHSVLQCISIKYNSDFSLKSCKIFTVESMHVLESRVCGILILIVALAHQDG